MRFFQSKNPSGPHALSFNCFFLRVWTATIGLAEGGGSGLFIKTRLEAGDRCRNTHEYVYTIFERRPQQFEYVIPTGAAITVVHQCGNLLFFRAGLIYLV
jgi:hypothetical protein